MTEVKTEVDLNTREARRAERLKVVATTQLPTVKVYAGSEDMRRVLRHPTGGRFRNQLDQAVDWPLDQFTKRRIADGSISTEGPGPAKPEPPDPKLSLRQQAAARQPKTEAEPRAAARPKAS